MPKQPYHDRNRYSMIVWLAPSRPGIPNRCCLEIAEKIQFSLLLLIKIFAQSKITINFESFLLLF